MEAGALQTFKKRQRNVLNNMIISHVISSYIIYYSTYIYVYVYITVVLHPSTRFIFLIVPMSWGASECHWDERRGRPPHLGCGWGNLCTAFCGQPMRVFPKIRVPQNGWFIVENPIKMDDLGIPLFLETPMRLWNSLFTLPWSLGPCLPWRRFRFLHWWTSLCEFLECLGGLWPGWCIGIGRNI